MKQLIHLFMLSFMMICLSCSNGGGGSNGSDADDTTPPTVATVIPVNGATGISVDNDIEVTFSETMDVSTITIASINLIGSGGPVSGTLTALDDNAIFTPAPSLQNGSIYVATITTSVADVAGNTMAFDYVWSFTTQNAADTMPPTISSTSPADSDDNVLRNSPIVAVFSEAMDPSSLTTASYTLSGPGGTPVAGSVNNSGTTATFTPAALLEIDAEYTVTISIDARDLAGNSIASAYSWSFETGTDSDETPPTVSATTPANGTTAVDVSTTILATFNEAMKENSLTTSSFTVTATGGGLVSGNVTGSETSVVFTPMSQLQGSTQYTATLTTAIQDLAGNAIASEYVWTFTTSDISAAVTVGGIVKDTSGSTVANVTVRVAGGNSTNTATDGTFSLVATPGDEQVVIFTREGYVTISKRVDLSARATVYLPVTLVAEAAPQTLDAAVGGTITGLNNAFLTARASAFVDENSDPVTGNVDVYLTPLDPSIPVQADAYPGTMLGRTTQGEIVVLETFGVVDATVRQNGETLQIKNGETVAIGIPARSQGETPATTNMWYFDETTGLWEQTANDGIFDSNTHTYQTDVTHLTLFNSDNPSIPTCINGMVQDAEGKPVIAYIEAIPQGENQEGNITSDFSEADGFFCIYVQKDTTVLLKVYTADTVGGTINFDAVTERTIETGGTIPISRYPFDCSKNCKRIWPSITIGEEDPGPINDVASCIYAESGFNYSDNPFWGTCASALGDLYACYAPEGRCVYEMDPFGWFLTGIMFEMEFENGSRMESTMGIFGPETKMYGPDPANELCGKVNVDEDGEITFSIGDKDIILRTTETGALEIECNSGFKFTLTGDQLDAISGCNNATDTNDAGVECRAKAGTYTADCDFDFDCDGFLSCCGPFGEKQCLQTTQCDLACTQDTDCIGKVCCDAGYLRMCLDFNACQALQGDEESH